MKTTKMDLRIETITPEIAREYLEQAINNWPVSKATVDAYARIMRDGKWSIAPDAIAFDINGNLINGVHRLKAVIESGTTQEFFVVAGLPLEALASTDTCRHRTGGEVLYIADNYK